MTETSTVKIESQPFGRGKRIILPTIPPGQFKWLGILSYLISFGLFIHVILASIQYFKTTVPTLILYIDAVGLPLFSAVFLIFFGLVLTSSRKSEIIIDRDRFAYTCCKGPGFLKRSWQCHPRQIISIQLDSNSSDKHEYRLSANEVIIRHGQNRKDIIAVGFGCSPDYLAELVNFLNDELQKVTSYGPSLKEYPPQNDNTPTDCSISFKRRHDGVTYRNQPIVNHTTPGQVIFTLLWNGFITFATIAALQSDGPLWALLLIPFWIFGILFIVGLFYQGESYAIVDVVGQPAEYLAITQKTIFGVKQQQWHIDEIDRVVCGFNGHERDSSDGSYRELHVYLLNGRKFRLWSEQPDEDLKWFVDDLEKSLDISQATLNQKASTLPMPPSLNMTTSDEGIKITKLPYGYEHFKRKIIAHTLCMLFAVGLCLVAFVIIYFGDSCCGDGACGEQQSTLSILIGGLPFLGVFGFFVLMFAVMLLSTIKKAVNSVVFEVTGHPPKNLIITEKSLFKTKQQKIPAEYISQITWEDTGMVINDDHIKQLQIHRTGGPIIKIMKGCQHKELAWIAHQLQQAVKPPSHFNVVG